MKLTYGPSNRPWIPPVASLGISVVIAALFLLLRSTGSLEYLELKVYDAWLRWRPDTSLPTAPIIVIGINDDDIGYIGHSQLTDKELADLLSGLEKWGPRAIGVDLVRDIPVGPPAGGEELKTVLNGNSNIVVLVKLFREGSGRHIPPPGGLEGGEESDQVACADIIDSDPDQIVRRGLITMKTPAVSHPVPSMAMRLALLALEPEGIEPRFETNGDFQFGKAFVRRFNRNDGGYVRADDAGNQILLDYRRRSGFRRLEYTKWLTNEIRPEDIRDKIVLIGNTSEIDKDVFSTPIGRDVSGVDLHAMEVDQLMRMAQLGSAPIRVWSGKQEAAWIALWAILGGMLGYLERPPTQFSLLLICGLLVIPVAAFILFCAGWWIPVVPAAMTWFTAAAIVTSYISYREKVSRAAVERLFERHVDPAVVKHLLKNRDRFLEGGKLVPSEVTATVLFTDLKDFSIKAGRMNADALIPWLDEYFGAMSRAVGRYDGVINKFMGDAIMAVFGAPITRTTEQEFREDARRAVRCALAMREELAVQNARWKAKSCPTTEMRVGICTGRLSAGSVGSAERLEYTVIGDIVNIAARLESVEPEVTDEQISTEECRILISGSTRDMLDARFHTKVIGTLRLKNIDHPVDVHGVIGADPELPAPTSKEKSR